MQDSSASISQVPEILALQKRSHLLRIPQEIDIPLTPRVRRLVDSEAFRRLSRISQLGLVAQVYPAATHSRFEHSLGVYRNALLILQRLHHHPPFATLVSCRDAEKLIVAALLHDIGHWPFCHPIEDLRLPHVPRHETFAQHFLEQSEFADALREDWGIEAGEVWELSAEPPGDAKGRLLSSILSGPIDVDKMDYLYRDSLHAGVPYGRNFDHQRLIGSLTLSRTGDALAITDKGRTATEMMVFARYVMFSEVYWHHAVRSATAMLQRAFYSIYDRADLDHWFGQDEQQMIGSMFAAAEDGLARPLLDGLFGPKRRLHKRLCEFSHYQHREMFEKLARRPYPFLVDCANRLADLTSQRLGRRVAPHEVLIDAPPVKLEVEFNIDVHFTREDEYRQLETVSPVVGTLARNQFDDYVKRVRVFVSPELAGELQGITELEQMLCDAIGEGSAA
ncbi:MAG: HD domain-containing protein [Planctomycetota bacterium]